MLTIRFQYTPTLATLLTPGTFYSSQQAEQKRCSVGYEQFAFFPTDLICLVTGCAGFDAGESFILRLTPRPPVTVLEVAARNGELAESMMKRLHAVAAQLSIYRNQFVEVRPASSMRMYDGMPGDELAIVFKERPRITDKEIVLDDRIHAVLRRTFFDFFKHRERLRELGLPRKRTLLLYGPPGTGKTHTCRYVHTALENLTTFQVEEAQSARSTPSADLHASFTPLWLFWRTSTWFSTNAS